MIKINKIRGFTLIELMITVVIIGILAAIAIPSYQYYVEKTNLAHAKQEMTAMRQALVADKLANPRDYNNQSAYSNFLDRQKGYLPKDVTDKYEFSFGYQTVNGLTSVVMTATPKKSSYVSGLWSGANGNILKCPKDNIKTDAAQPTGCENY